MPYFFHVLPVVDDTMLNRVGEFEDTLLGLGFLADIAVLVHADHDVFVFGSSDH